MNEKQKNQDPAEIENAKHRSETMTLYQAVIESRPSEITTNEEKIEELNSELNNLAKKLGIPLEELLIEAESSPVFKEEYLKAISLFREIAFLKNNV